MKLLLFSPSSLILGWLALSYVSLSLSFPIFQRSMIWLSIMKMLSNLHEFLICRKLRISIHGKLLVNLSLALMGVYIFFLISGHVTTVPVLCGISSALLHYFLLVFFGWTAVEAVWLYLKLVKVLGMHSATSNYILKTSIPTWGKKSIQHCSSTT